MNLATSVDTSDLAAKKDLIALKDEVDKIDINKLVNFPTSLNNLEIKKDNLDVGKLKFIPADLKKLSDIVANEVVKCAKLKTLKTKVNSLENKIPYATTLIQINQYNTEKQSSEKKIGDVDKKNTVYECLVTTTVLKTKLVKLRTKCQILVV